MLFKAMRKQLLTIALLFAGALSFTANAQTYCSAGPSSTYDSELTGVVLTGDNFSISQTSTACGTTGVQNFTATDSADVSLGTSYSLAVTMGTCGGTYSGAIAAWIDWNQDGDFTDVGEQLGTYSGSPTTTQNWSFTVPSTATLGTTRMRVMQREGGSATTTTPCATFSWGAVEDYSIVVTNTPPACTAPSNLVITPAATSAAVSWDSTSTVSHYVVEYDTAGFSVGSGDTVWSYGNSATISSLMAATDYDVYVYAVCTGGSSASITASTTTLCLASSIPWSENFDAGSSGSSSNPSLPTCWDYYSATSSSWSNYIYVYGWVSYSASNSLRFYESSSSSYIGDTSFAILPEIVGLDSANKQLKFWGRKGTSSGPGRLILAVTDAAGSASSLRILDTLYMTSSVFEEYTVYLDSAAGVQTGDARVALGKINDGTYDYMYIDDVSIEEIPPCPNPLDLLQTGSTQTSATISWSSSGSAFNIEYGPVGFTQGTGDTASATGGSGTLTGLTANTYYDVYIQSDCSSSGDGYSTWSGPLTVKTACASYAVPYSNDFDASNAGSWGNYGILPDCWLYATTSLTSSPGYAYVYNSSSMANSGSQLLYFYMSSSSSYSDSVIVMGPKIDDLGLGDKEVLFEAYTPYTSSWYNPELIVGLADSNGTVSSITIVDTINLISDATTPGSYEQYKVQLTSATSADSRVVLMAVNNGYTQYLRIDDFEVREIPNCPDPLDVSGFATSDTSAGIQWRDTAFVAQYIIEYGPEGFTQGTGMPVDTVTGVTSYLIDSLAPGTCYDFYISSYCSATSGVNSPWSGPFTVCTPCAAKPTPFTEGWENAPGSWGSSTNPNLPDCWSYSGSGGSMVYQYVYSSSWYAYEGSYVWRYYTSSSSSSSDRAATVSPMIQDLDQYGKQVTFMGRGGYSNYPRKLFIGTVDVTGHVDSVNVIDSVVMPDGVYTPFSIYLDSAAGVKPGDSRVVLFSKGGTYDYGYVDSLVIRDADPCVAYNFTTSNVGTTGADADWSFTSGASSFSIEYGPCGFSQGSGTSGGGTIDSTTTQSYTFSGLNPNTCYDYYVQANCNTGVWYGPFSFHTACTGKLGGTYTVGTNGDFATLDSALSTLNVCGMDSSVTFNLLTGVHSGAWTISAGDADSAKSITINGTGLAADSVNGSFFIENTENITLQNMHIYDMYGSQTIRINGSHNVTIDNNVINGNATTTTWTSAVITTGTPTSATTSSTGVNDLTITDNVIRGGYYAMAIVGPSSKMTDVTVTGNTITEAYYYGPYLRYIDGLEFSDNTIADFRNTYNYGMYFYYIDNFDVVGNSVNSYYGMLFGYANQNLGSATATRSTVVNNMSPGYYGCRFYGPENVDVINNTFSGSYAGLYMSSSADNVDVINNICDGGSYGMYYYYSSWSAPVDFFLDYNLYNSSSTLARLGSTSATTLADIQAIDTTMNIHSVVGDPLFVSATDLHCMGTAPNDVGDNSVAPSVDIDGDARPSSMSTTVDIGADEYDVFSTDATATMLVSPANNTCGGDSLMVEVQFQNLGIDTITSITVGADIMGQSLSVTDTTLSVAFGDYHTMLVGYVNQLVGGTYSVVAYTALTGDQDTDNDSLTTSFDLQDAQQVQPWASASEVCSGDSVALAVAFPADGSFLFTSGADTIGTVEAGDTIWMTGLTQDTTVTLSTLAVNGVVGLTTNGSSGSNYSWSGPGLLFTAGSNFTLDSVTLYPSDTGYTVIEIQDVVNGSVVYNDTVWTTATGNAPEDVYLGATFTPGDYKIIASSIGTGGLYREYGVTSYPMSTPGGEVIITNGTLNNYYYFFYNWRVSYSGCDRADSTIAINLYDDAVAALSLDTAAALTDSTFTLGYDASASAGYDSLSVSFDVYGQSGTTQTYTTVTGATTQYTNGDSVIATLIVYGPCSTDTVTASFVVNGISVQENFMNGTLNIFPNPTRGIFNVEFATDRSQDVEISIVNLLGEVISTRVVTVNGAYTEQFDLSDEAAGIYLIRFTTDEGVLTERITVE